MINTMIANNITIFRAKLTIPLIVLTARLYILVWLDAFWFWILTLLQNRSSNPLAFDIYIGFDHQKR
jgi:hypothetical protein